MEETTCPECKAIIKAEEWIETSVACEDCGEHPAAACPYCGETIDLVLNDDPREENN